MQSQSSTVAKTETIIIKIGTAALSADDGKPDEERLGNLIEEMAELIHAGHRVILVTSGAVGTGKTIAAEFGLDTSALSKTQKRQIEASIGQPDLMAIYKRLFQAHGILAAQVLTEKNHFITNGNGSKGMRALFKRTMRRIFGKPGPNPDIINYFDAALQLKNFTAIVNENDTAAIRELMFTDNDELTGYIAKLVKADRVIFLSSGHGICNTGKDLSKENVIPFINFADPESPRPTSTKGKTADGSGGMDSKYTVTEDLTHHGMLLHVASSKEENVLTRIMNDESMGTTLVYDPNMSSRPTAAATNVTTPTLHQ